MIYGPPGAMCFTYIISRLLDWRIVEFNGVPYLLYQSANSPIRQFANLQELALHVSPVLPAHLVERMGDLAKSTVLHRFHQLLKNVSVGHGHLLQLREGLL